MIYMRERQNNKKRGEAKEESTRSYIDQLKSKFAKKNAPKELEAKQENTRKENDIKPAPSNQKPQKYAIGKSKTSQANPSESKYSQSIIVHDLPDNANPLFNKKSTKSIVKCFDIQILNDLSTSRYRAQAYIQILQREKELKAKQILNLKELLAAKTEEDYSPFKDEVQQLKKAIDQQNMQLNKYMKFFSQGKDLFLTIVMELIDSRNELNFKQTDQQLRKKEKTLTRCIERIERVVSIYSNFIEFSLKKTPQEIMTVDELWNNVKYQEKIIQLMKENENNRKVSNYHHENTLLRYEINRLSKHNEQLLKLINNHEDSIQFDYSESYPNHLHHSHHRPQESIIVHQQDSDEIEEESNEESSISQEKEQTPFQKLKPQFSPSIEHPFSNLQVEGLSTANTKLEKELSECKNRVSVLEVEKEYVLDQLQQLQKGEKQLKEELKAVMQENEELRLEARELRVSHLVKQENYEVAKESEKAMEEQNELLKEKMKFILKPNGKETVTVEELLKLLKRKELAHYHQALMELISKYEQRISELTNSYLYQRELKQHSLTYCKGLFNLVQATSNSRDSPSLQQIIDYINKYEQIMAELKENEIDVYLRKIKSFSIGIDENSVDTIKEELKDYVYQLQTRLPTLCEEYLEDGSSIADSHHTSLEKFE